MKRILLLLAFALFSLQTSFSQMEFVQDINLGFNSSNPRNFIQFQGQVYFIGSNSSGNQSIFSIDSNETITEVSTFSFSVQIIELLALNDQLYARVRSVILPQGDFSDPQLWKINLFGTNEKLTAFCGNYETFAYDSFVFNNELYFSGQTSCLSNGFRQLYAYNGSTFRLVDAENLTSDFSPNSFAVHNNELYFRGFTPSTGQELFKTNGSTVTLVKDIIPGSTGSNLSYLTSYNGLLYLSYITSETGGISDLQLFKLNTSSNTITPTGIYLGSELTIFDNKIYFSQRNPGSTSSQLASLDANDNLSLIPFFDTSEPHLIFGYFTSLDNTLYVVGRTDTTGNELYKFTIGSTLKRVEDYNPGIDSSTPVSKISFNNNIYFGANNGNGLGIELHKYTPETVITTPIADSSFEQLLINLGLDTAPLNGEVPTENIETITTLDISSMNISNISGIEDFTALEEFTTNQNPISILDFSSNANLRKVTTYNCPLVSINVTQNLLLTDLTISNTTGVSFNTLDITQNENLLLLDLSTNNISSINLANNILLQTLRIGNNPIDTIDLSQNTNLVTLSTYSTAIPDLDLSNHPNLNSLISYSGALISLSIKSGNNTNLSFMDVSGNPDLSCIEVDNEIVAQNNSNWIKDLTTVYSENCSTLSINDNTFEEEFSVYPNPSKHILNIELKNYNMNTKATIYDIQGKRLITKTLDTESNIIDISKIESGIYLLIVETRNSSITRRFFKQ